MQKADQLVSVRLSDLDLICRALRLAEDEIHHPGTARANDYDVMDLIDQAYDLIVKRVKETPQ